MNPISDEPLSDAEFNWLEDFLLNRIDDDTDTLDMDEGIFCISELDGLLTAVVSGPVMLSPSQWLPQVWGDFEPEFDSAEEFEKVLMLMMRHMNNIVSLLMEQPQDFEPMFLVHDVDGETHTIVDEWCEGYMRGVMLTEEQWQLQNIDMKILITPITAFQGEQAFITHDQYNSQQIRNLQQAIISNVREIHAYWLAQRADLAPASFRHSEEKSGRNDPCPCGSGKKYKKCCLH
ncbi:hypothetical protein MNBD_GAMMA06-1001 [hydrothermal vent metagenome]|uniref:YecA family protein n=1 Tax=hydrothermal vent metagenome TaxID=652676 RepID=A0A3B0X515_9ZZZZ